MVVPAARLARRPLAAITDADGKGEIQDCRAEDIMVVRVEAAGLGSR